MTDMTAEERVARVLAPIDRPHAAVCLPSAYDNATPQQRRKLHDMARAAIEAMEIRQGKAMSDDLVRRLKALAGAQLTPSDEAEDMEVTVWNIAQEAADRIEALEAENARLTDVAAQAHSLFDLCWNAIQTAIAHEDGLDGAVGETLMAEIRAWQARNSDAIRALAESEKP